MEMIPKWGYGYLDDDLLKYYLLSIINIIKLFAVKDHNIVHLQMILLWNVKEFVKLWDIY